MPHLSDQLSCSCTVTDSGNTEYSCMKANVIHDGTTAYISVYGIVNTGTSDSVTLTAVHNGSTVEVKAVSTGGASAATVQYSLSGCISN
jgi:archaellum component FlaF (FlaF/FlaG flagellin family)